MTDDTLVGSLVRGSGESVSFLPNVISDGVGGFMTPVILDDALVNVLLAGGDGGILTCVVFMFFNTLSALLGGVTVGDVLGTLVVVLFNRSIVVVDGFGIILVALTFNISSVVSDVTVDDTGIDVFSLSTSTTLVFLDVDVLVVVSSNAVNCLRFSFFMPARAAIRTMTIRTTFLCR